jgi:hypothetical protein
VKTRREFSSTTRTEIDLRPDWVSLARSPSIEWTEGLGPVPEGARPAVSAFRAGLIAISDTIGNDVEFHASIDYQTWTPAQPSPVFDDGEGARDIPCSDESCVGVGFLDATYRSELKASTGVAWVNASGDEFQPVDHEFNTVTLDAVAWNPSGFLVSLTALPAAE